MVSIGQLVQTIVFFAIFFLALLMSIGGSNKYLPKYDTQVRILFVHFLLLSFLLLVTVAGMTSYKVGLETHNSTLLILSCVLIAPSPLLLLSYGLIRFAVRKVYNAVPLNAKKEDSGISEAIRIACARENIDEPEILVSGTPFLSPQVLGSYNKAYLILPSNWTEILQSIGTRVSSDIQKALLQFIVDHELTHLRNKDFRLFTWIGCFLRIIITLWIPVYSMFILLSSLTKGSFNPFSTFYVSLVLPSLNIGVLYLLMLSVLRDRELLADHASFELQTTWSKSEILKPSITMDQEKIAPLALAFRMFRCHHSAMLGVSQSSIESVKKSATMQNSLGRIPQFLVEVLRPFVESHPSSALRIKSLSSGPDNLNVRQGDKENGMFAGLAVGLLMCYWGFGTRAFGSQPTSDLFFLTTLIASGILAASVFLPARHISGMQMGYVEYDRMVRLKLVYSSIGSALTMVLMALPVITRGEFWLSVRIGIFVSSGAYVFWQMIFMIAVASGMLEFSQTKTLWRVAIRLMIGLFALAILAA